MNESILLNITKLQKEYIDFLEKALMANIHGLEYSSKLFVKGQQLRDKIVEATKKWEDSSGKEPGMMGDFFGVLEENYQAAIAGFYNVDETDEQKKCSLAIIQEYEDLIGIYKSKKWLQPQSVPPYKEEETNEK